MDNKFTKMISLYQRDEKGEYLLREGEKIVDKELGIFIFKRPTVKDEMEMRIEKLKSMRGLKPEELDDVTKLYLEYVVNFPRLCAEAPKDWSWEYNDPMIMIAITEAYSEGFSELNG